MYQLRKSTRRIAFWCVVKMQTECVPDEIVRTQHFGCSLQNF